ncbi:MAG: hypothetical protein KGH61_01970 [Candidatus Micrarchaeota archaeon]|nr:hypothetical protein [Candidatus Micrarchaeota archaeon]MDE1847697.1 hypothetical protein [Candidatus Micrarchaeota archaeon]MDE1864126.1 hypothetical protein [Candidatus Micrarchaeota archaeon]
MKVYLVSNVEAETEEIVDALDDANVSVVAKEIEGNAQDAAQIIARQLGKGSSDVLVFLTDDTMDAGMELNKVAGIKAAICNSPGEVQKAKVRGANVIIVGEETGDLGGIARAVASEGASERVVQTPRPQQQKRNAEERIAGRQEEEERTQSKQIRINIKVPQLFAQKPRPQPEPADEPLPMGKPRKGILGKLKDELGIVD